MSQLRVDVELVLKVEKALLANALAVICALAPSASVASEREANGWIYSNIEDAGLKLTYPASWKKTMIGSNAAEQDNILKVSGHLTGADDSWAELALLHAHGGMSPGLLAKVMEESFWSKMPEYKGSSEKPVRLPGAKVAVEKEMSFRQGGEMFSLRCLIFQIGANSYSLTMTCPLNQYHASGTIWNTAINNIASISSPQTNQTSLAHQSPQSPALLSRSSPVKGTASSEQPWRTKDGTLSLTLPASLKEEVVEDGDHLLKASSSQNGRMISLDIYHGENDHSLGLSELSSTLEDKHFLSLKNYQKIAEENSSMGSGGSVPGVVRESTFDMNGVKIHHMSGYILADKSLYAICLSTAGINSNEAHQIWSRISASVVVRR